MTTTEGRADEYAKSHGRHAADVMTRNVVTVEGAAPLGAVVDLLEEKGIKRVPVVSDEKLIGIITRVDLLRGLAALKPAATPAAPGDDRAIRENVIAAFQEQNWAKAHSVVVTVDGGVAHL